MLNASLRHSRRDNSAQPFALSRRPRPLGVSLARYTSIAAVCGALLAGATAQAADVYLDSNGSNPGSGIIGGSSILWDANNTIWNDQPGTGIAKFWTANDTAIFAAGTDAAGPFTVTVDGAQSIGGLKFLLGGVTLVAGPSAGSGLVMTGNANFDVGTDLTATVNTVISGTSDLTKLGSGTLVLGGANTYAGRTIIGGGTLSISSEGNLGAVPASAAPDSISFTGNSTLQFTGAGPLTLNANRGINIGDTFTGTVQIVSAASSLTYGGLITGNAGATFRKAGPGALGLTAASTLAGALNIDGGTVTLSGNGALISTSGVTIGNRATFTLDNSGTNVADRTAGALTSTGGTINFIGNAAATTETLGDLTLNAGALTINSNPGAGGSVLTIPTLTRIPVGGTLYLNGTGLGGANNQVVLGTAPALVNSVLKYAVVNDGTLVSFANYATSAGTNQSVIPLPLASHNQGAETTWVAASNARPTADTAMAASRLAYTLTLDSGIDILISTADRSLTLGGAVLQTGGTSVVGTAGGTIDTILAFGANEALFHILGSLQLNRGDATATLTGTAGLTKSGTGTLILNGVSTLTAASGAFNANEGVLELRGATSLMTTAATLNLNGANLRLTQVAGTTAGVTYLGNPVVNADTTITISRVDNLGTATAHTIGTLSIGGGRTLSLNSLNLTGAYTLSTGAATITVGGATFDVGTNGTLALDAVTSNGNAITKTGAGDLMNKSTTGGFGGGVVDIQAGRFGFTGASGTFTDASTFTGAGSLLKSGAGAVNLTGASTFTGGITVSAGTLGFSTVSNNGGPASSLGQGTNGITLSGGTLSFNGATSQSTNRAISVTASSTLNASGTSGATITYTGAITPAVDIPVILTGTATGGGTISGGLIMPAGAASADLSINSGTWTLTGSPVSVADDTIVTGATAVLNLNATDVLTGTGTSNGLYARTGATINLGANGALTAGGNDFMFIGDTGVGTLNTGTFSVLTPQLNLGDDDNLSDVGNVIGTGTLTVTTNINLMQGTISANLAGAGTILKQGVGAVVLSGDNSGLTTAAGPATIEQGNLLLDYTTSNTPKLVALNSVTMNGGTLTINGNASADTTQSILALTLTNSAPNTIAVNRGGLRSATLNLGNITRTAGTLRFLLPQAGAITTTRANVNGVLGGWATATDPTGTYFAANDGLNNIVIVTPLPKDDVSGWETNDNISDFGAFGGTLGRTLGINTLRFDAAAASTVTIGAGQALGINSGGILQTSKALGGASTITGGKLVSGSASELIFTLDSPSQIFTVASTITGGASISKSGDGTLLLSGTNNYSGATRILSGTLQVSGGNAIPDTSAIAFTVDHDATLELLGSETIGALSGGANSALSALSVVRLNGNALTVNQTASGTYSGNLIGDAGSSLSKMGTGNLQLSTGALTGFAGTVTVNQGLFYLSVSTTLPNVTAFTVNRGSFMIDGNGTTTTSARIADTTPITLNSTDGNWSGETRPSGLAVRRDQGTAYSETVGVITLNSGASYTRLDATVTNAVAAIVTDNIVRANAATLDVRGTKLSATTAQRAQLRIGTAANQTAFINAMVGGGSTTLGTKNISIVPWAISEEYAAGIADTNMGNSLATYVSGNGFRPLSLTTEYNTFGTKATNQDNIRESLAADLTGVAGQTINALVVNNSNTAANSLSLTGTGAGQTLAVTSGTMLFTATAATTGTPAMGITLNGFDAGITVGSTNEYVLFVQNPTSTAATGLVTATIESPLASSADITKSGRGTLVLTGSNLNAGGGARKTTINEGVLQIADLDNIGGGTGALVFAGGTLKVGVGATPTFGDDLSTRGISFLTAGGTLDTNTLDLTFANSLGSGAGPFTKTGAGNLTLNAATTHTGTTTIAGGTVTLGASGAISTGALTVTGGTTLAMGANNQTVAALTLSNAANSITGSGTLTVNGDAFVNRGTIDPVLAGSMNLIKQTATQVVALSNTANTYTGYTHVQDGILSVPTLANIGAASSLGAPTGENAQIRLGNTTTTGTLLYTGDTGSTDRMIVLTGTTGGGTIGNNGIGALTLAGNITGTDYGTKAITLQGTATGFTNVVSGVISDGLGTIAVTKAEAGTWSLTRANTYTGGTNFNAGTLIIGHNQAFSTGPLNFNGGTLLDDGNAHSLANTVVLGGNSTIAGTTDFTFTGPLSQTGADRTLTVNSTGVTSFNGAFTLDRGTSNGIVTVSAGTGATVNIANLQDGAGTGTGGLTKTGVGALNIANAFTINGGLVASGGVTTLAGVGVTSMGNLQVGRNSTGTLNYNTAGGSLVVGTGAANVFEVGVSSGSVSNGTLNLAGLDSLTVNVGSFRVGSFNGSGSTTLASATLATNNTITAATEFAVADNQNSGTGLGGPVTLVFGTGTNTVTTPKVTLANGKSAGTAPFTNVSLPTGATLSISSGTSTATDLLVGTENVNTGTIMETTVDFTGGIVTATLDDVIIAQRSAGGAGTTKATLSFGSGANAITANTLSVASVNTGTGATGTLNFGGGTFNLAGDAALASFTASGAVRGTLNLTGGTFTVGGNITKSAGSANVGVLIVDGATLDMTDGTIAATQLGFRGGSISNIATGGITLDAVAATATPGLGSTGDALILRDVTLNSTVALTGATGGSVHYENANGGSGATINGALSMGAVARTFNVEDSAGSAIELTINGDLSGTAGFTKIGAGTLRLTGATAQTYTGATAIQEGRLILGGGADNRIAATNAVTLGNGATSAVLQLGGATGKSDLTLNSLSVSGTGTANAIVGGASTLSTLTLNLAAGGTLPIKLGGTGTNESNLSLVKNGTFSLSFPGANNISGALTVNGGTLTGGFGPTGTTISLAAGAGLNFNDSTAVARTLGNPGDVLTLGAGSTLGFEIGAAAGPFTDQILGSATSKAVVSGLVNINLFSLGNLSAGPYTLISMPGGGLVNSNGSSGSYAINSAPGGFQFNLVSTDTLLQLNISSVNIPTMYWRNGIGDSSWSSLSSGDSNWTTDLAGTANAHATPAGGTDVVFSADTAPLNAGAIVTRLDGNFTVKSLTFVPNPVGVGFVSIASGTPANSTLTISPTDSAAGITVPDTVQSVVITAPLVIAASQTWAVGAGSTLLISGGVSGTGDLTKTGDGTAVLSGNVTYGATVISAGVLKVGDGGLTGTLGTGAVTNNGSLVLDYGTGANTAVPNTISGAGTLTKNGAGVVTLSGPNTYTGKTVVTGGILKVSSEANLGGNPAALTADQLSLSGGALLQATETFAIDDSNRGITVGSGGGGISVDAGKTVTVNGVITGSGSFLKGGTGTLVFVPANSYTGGTIIDGGTLKSSVSLAMTGGLTFGSAAASSNAGLLDVSSGGASFTGGLVVQNNTGAAANIITVGTGQTLSFGGNVIIGANPASAANANARLTIDGGGSLNVLTPAAGLFQVGAHTSSSTTLSQASTLDLTNLSSATINVSATGTVRVNQPTTTNVAGNQSTLLLPTPTAGITPTTPVTTITSQNFNVGDGGGLGSGVGQINVVALGTGLTTLNANTVNIGTGIRDLGQLTFAAGNGTLRLRAANGTGRAAFNVATGGANTGVSPGTGLFNNVNFTGHDVNLLISTLTIGSQNRNTARTDSVTFDTGTFDATGVVVGTNSGSANASAANTTWTSTLNLAGITTTIGATGLDIGNGAAAVTGTDVIAATVNISAGNVTVANNTSFGAAIRLGQNSIATGLTANGTLNLTGGTLTVAGNIVRGALTGAGSATVTLDGGTLDMSGKNIGSATNLVTFNAQKGTLSNLGELNGGALLTKTGPDTLVLTGTNNYTGGTTISAGTLQVGDGATSGNLGTGAVINNANLNFSRTDAVAIASTISGTGTITQNGGLLTLNGAVTGQALHAASGQVKLGAGDTTPANPNHSLTALTIDGNSTVQFMTGGLKLVQATSLSLAGTAKLDLTGNAFVLDYLGSVEDPAQTAAVAARLQAGFNGGPWNGAGIMTSKVGDDQAANPTTYQFMTGLGYMPGSLTGGTFLGRAVDAGSVVARYTYYGDANLDGVVNGLDYSLIDNGFANQNTPGFVYGWVNGDFNYDGRIDGADYALMDTAAAYSNGAPIAPAPPESFAEASTAAAPDAPAASFGSAPEAQLASMPTAVPEPASFGLLMLGGAVLGLRRRRANQQTAKLN